MIMDKKKYQSNQFHTKKSLGQNFLKDEVLLQRLVELSAIPDDANILEIGTGLGNLTEPLAARASHLTTIEIDDRLIPILQVTLSQYSNISLVHGNALTLDLNELTANKRPFHVVANIPYYLTTELLTKLLTITEGVLSINVMVQKEAAERMIAAPGCPGYCMLSVLCALKGKTEILCDVPAAFFDPRPKCESSFVRIAADDHAVYTPEQKADIIKAAECAFAMRRKTYVNNMISVFHLSKQEATEIVTSCGFSPVVRGETFGIRDFALIAEKLKQIR